MKILISTSSFGKENTSPLELLKEQGFDVMLNPYGRQLTIPESVSLLKEVDGIIAGTEKINSETLQDATLLKYIVRLGTGMDSVDFGATEQKGIKVENTPDAHVDGVAELTLGGILSSLRGIARSDRHIKQGNWEKPMGALLKGKTVGLVGMGRVAKRLVQLLQPFQCKLIAYDPFFDEAFAAQYGVTQTSLNELYAQADIVSLHLPFAAENRYIIDAAALSQMKDDVLIVNTSRGGLIQEEDLLHFLSNNTKAKAYLDTFEQEPYNGPLAQLENVQLTGHIGTYAKEVRVIMELEAANKLINFFSAYGK